MSYICKKQLMAEHTEVVVVTTDGLLIARIGEDIQVRLHHRNASNRDTYQLLPPTIGVQLTPMRPSTTPTMRKRPRSWAPEALVEDWVSLPLYTRFNKLPVCNLRKKNRHTALGRTSVALRVLASWGR